MTDRPDLDRKQPAGEPLGADALRAESQHLGKQSLLQAGIDNAVALVTDDKELRSEIAHYASAGLKTAALFYGGRMGVASTVGLYALDNAKMGDDATTMMIDGSLGAAKGAAMRGTFALVGHSRFDPAAKALALGVGARFSENFLERTNYYNPSGSFDLGQGLQTAFSRSFDQKALGTDVVNFGISYGMFRGLNGLSGGALANSRVASTSFLGGSFGLVTGAQQELAKQSMEGQIDWTKVAFRGGTTAMVDAIAAIPGGLQAARAANASTRRELSVEEQAKGLKTEPDAPGDALRRAAFERPVVEKPIVEKPVLEKPVVQPAAAPPKLELTADQIGVVRHAARQNGLWMIETSKVERAADGTPKVMLDGHGTFQTAAVGVSNLATQLKHAVTLNWNGVDIRIEPNMTPARVEVAWKAAENAPARLEMLRKQNEAVDLARAQEQARAEQKIEALRSQPTRPSEQLFEQLRSESAYVGAEFGQYAMSRLRHPGEILAFARMYQKMAPDAAIPNMRSASERGVPGTAKAWQEAIDKVSAERPAPPTLAEQALFGRIKAHQSMKDAADKFDLSVRDFNETTMVVEPRGPISIREAGVNAGRFATSLQRPEVSLSFNGKLIPIKAGANMAEVEAAWRAAQ
jgi:hypothetical protein